MKKLLTGIMMMALCLGVLGACNKENKEVAKQDNGDLVAKVNGQGVSKSDFESMLERMKATYTQQGIDVEELDEQMIKQMESQVLDQLINAELLSQLATKAGIEVQEENVNKQLEAIKANFESVEKYQEALDKNELTEAGLLDRIREDLRITQFLENNVGQVKVTDEEIKKAYDEYKSAMVSQKQEVQTLEDFKMQLEAQILAKKKQEKITNIIEKLKLDNDIEILI